MKEKTPLPEWQISNARNNIRVLRESHGYAQIELTEKLKFTGNTKNRLDAIERGIGHLHLSELITIADFFGVSVDDLLKKKAKISFE